ncbi:MAG: ATP-binding protein [Anaerolineae bacterium]
MPYLNEETFDAILLDLFLPDCQGDELVTQVRHAAQGVPVLALVTAANAPLGEEAMKVGAEDYLVKETLNSTQLARALRYAMSNQTLRADRDQKTEALKDAIDQLLNLTESQNGMVEQLEMLNRISAAAANNQNETQILAFTCAELARYFNVPQTAVALIDETREYELVVAEYLEPGRPSALNVKIPYGANPSLQAVLEAGNPVAIKDVRLHPATKDNYIHLEPRGTVSMLLVPIPLRGQTIGSIGIDTLKPRQFSDQDIQIARLVAEKLGHTLENARLYAYLRAHAAELENRVAERTQELVEANERLQELDRLKSKFVSDVSHELRTPITNLMLYLDLMEHAAPERKDAYLNTLQEQANRLQVLIEDVLNLSRLETKKAEIVFDSVDLNRIVSQVITNSQPRAQATHLQLTFTPMPDLPQTWGNASQLEQVVTNLVTNAINFTAQGAIIMRTWQDEETENIFLEVADTGRGIADTDLPHLFERFYRGHQTDKAYIPGTGLGLAIVKEIVEQHHGRIQVESVLGQGSVFTICLPSAKTACA